MKKLFAWIGELLSSDGRPSTMRFITIFTAVNINLMWDAACIVKWCNKGFGLEDIPAAVVAVLLAVVAGKVTQAAVEKKPDKPADGEIQESTT